VISVIGVIVAVVGLGFLILAHEFGHFMVAKLTGMRVEEFSIGFGRYLVSKRIGETVYGISMLPLGGSPKPGKKRRCCRSWRTSLARSAGAPKTRKTGWRVRGR
jgi:hypothetical protein